HAEREAWLCSLHPRKVAVTGEDVQIAFEPLSANPQIVLIDAQPLASGVIDPIFEMSGRLIPARLWHELAHHRGLEIAIGDCNLGIDRKQRASLCCSEHLTGMCWRAAMDVLDACDARTNFAYAHARDVLEVIATH